jgi:hypothetical protein
LIHDLLNAAAGLGVTSAGSPTPLPAGVPVQMRGPGLTDLAATVRDWSGALVSARPATAVELALPASATGGERTASAVNLPDDPRSVLIVWAECGSDTAGTLTVTSDRSVVLLAGPGRTDCGQPGARRGAVLTFGSDVPAGIAALAGF